MGWTMRPAGLLRKAEYFFLCPGIFPITSTLQNLNVGPFMEMQSPLHGQETNPQYFMP